MLQSHDSRCVRRSMTIDLVRFTLLYGVLAWGALMLSQQMGLDTAFWGANAVGVAYLIQRPRNYFWPLLWCAAAANGMAHMLCATPALLLCLDSAARVVEMGGAAWLIRHAGAQHGFDDSASRLGYVLVLGALLPALLDTSVVALAVTLSGGDVRPLMLADCAGETIAAMAVLPLSLVLVRDGWSVFTRQGNLCHLACFMLLTLALSAGTARYVPSTFVYVMVPLMLGTVVLHFSGVALLVFANTVACAVLVAAGRFLPLSPASGMEDILLLYGPLVVAVLMPLLLAASKNQTRLRERAQRQSVQLLVDTERQTLIDHLPGMVGYWDTALINRFCNRAYLEWLDRSAAQVHGTHLRAILGEARFVSNWPYIEHALAGRVAGFERRIVGPRGEARHVLASYVPDKAPDGKVIGFYAFVTDLSPVMDARQAEAQARDQRQSIIDAASEFAIVATDLAGCICVFSTGAERMLGYRSEEMLGIATPLQYHVAAQVETLRLTLSASYGYAVSGFEALTQTARRGNPAPQEWDFVCKDGSQIPVSLVITAMHGPDGEPSGFLGIAHNISSQRQLQASLIAARDEADAASRAKSAFVANMSHEIRTPMNAVLGVTRLLAGTSLTRQQQAYLTMITTAGVSLLGILNDILDFSKIEANCLELAPLPFLLTELFDSVAAIMMVTAHEKGLALVFSIDPAVPATLVGDIGRMRQIIINLTGNAIKFTASGSVTVGVRLQHLGDGFATVCFSVRDTGIGIEAGQQARLFLPFTQADVSVTRRFGGTGLGLVICKRLAHLMGGQMALDSQAGQGSEFRFTIRLPCLAEQGRHVHTGVASAPAGEMDTLLAGVRLLLVEDNSMNQIVARMMLEQAGASVDVVSDGLQAVEIMTRAAHQYDVILMDVQMPVMDGYTATRIVRQTLGLQIPIVAMTAGAMHHEQDQCRAAGMNDFIAKPIDMEQMFAIILRQMPSALPSLPEQSLP